jgi:hypothetical protein
VFNIKEGVFSPAGNLSKNSAQKKKQGMVIPTKQSKQSARGDGVL